jgi:formate dehydrogenase iron-sulfur subunit
VGVTRRQVFILSEGFPTELSFSLACYHCDEPSCLPVCPVKAISKRADGIVQTDKKKCISCQLCRDACPFGIPAFLVGKNGKLGPQEKCTFCAGGPNVEIFSREEMELYGQNRIAEGKPPLCASMCSTKSLLSGDEQIVRGILEKRIAIRNASLGK